MTDNYTPTRWQHLYFRYLLLTINTMGRIGVVLSMTVSRKHSYQVNLQYATLYFYAHTRNLIIQTHHI